MVFEFRLSDTPVHLSARIPGHEKRVDIDSFSFISCIRTLLQLSERF